MTTKVVNKKISSFDVYIGRPTCYGNPFVIGRDGNREKVIAKYRTWLMLDEQKKLRELMLNKLKGKILGCFCKPESCHGDVICEWVNSQNSKFV